MTQPENVGDRMRHIKDYIAEQNRKLPRVDNDGRPIAEQDDDAGQADPPGDDAEPPHRRGPLPDKSQGMTRPRVDEDTSAMARSTRAVFLAANTGMSVEQAMHRLGGHDP